MDERAWARMICDRLKPDLKALDAKGKHVTAHDGRKLPYANEIYSYDNQQNANSRPTLYETDLLISEVADNSGELIPRVVIECKLRIGTHDALTYSAKAATHKHVHPYLRYGILIGAREHYAIPGRLVRHGAHFDFMVAWRATEPDEAEWKSFVAILTDEVNASRKLQELLETARRSSRVKYHVLHRPLLLR